jgi:(1->4)-alpha-D-glucan 1-alpha-D-glucosylmutase
MAEAAEREMTFPRATLRLQFHKSFTFEDGCRIVPYLASLHVSHIYASPILTARAGSMHGYDVIDPTRINPELGGEAGYLQLVAKLREAGLGIIVDIVPNHMAVGAGNAWWFDVLQHGRGSRYAHYFDIDWEPDDHSLHGKVLVPVLGRPYGESLVNGAITLARNEALGRHKVRYFDHVFPIAPEQEPIIARLGLAAFDATEPRGRQRLHELLQRQHYRLAWWKTANDAINWRRFFDINELAAIRVEQEDVFDATHATLLRLFADGLIDGFRIDHVDGLSEPGAYCRRLRKRLEELAPNGGRPPGAPVGHPYLIVEKILAPHEHLPDGWGVDGTSGYDFMDQVSQVIHDEAGARPLGRLWASVSGRSGAFENEAEECRRQILRASLSAPLETTVTALHRLAARDLSTRDLARPAIRRALIELLAHLRVYRTYADADSQSPRDEKWLAEALAGAKRTCSRADRETVEQVARLLAPDADSVAPRDLRARAIRRFQQLSSPLAAKAIEDTAFYRYGRLLSRNDVGFDPAQLGGDISAFHRQCSIRAKSFPHSMLATATHDHKRGEDVRARLAVLSEIADDWSTALERWMEMARPFFEEAGGNTDLQNHRPVIARRRSRRSNSESTARTLPPRTRGFATLAMTVNDSAGWYNSVPSRGDAAMLFQMIVGAWPPTLSVEDRKGCSALGERLAVWQQKALREAKLATDWLAPDERYEAAARRFLMRVFASPLIADIAAFADRIAPAGAANGLAQILLKLTAPGVPDIYQGTEFWDLSLVDPDNRRAVDFEARTAALASNAPIASLASAWRDGRVKQAIIRDVLKIRKALPDLFSAGDYIPLQAEGPAANHVLGFARRHQDCIAITAVCRLVARLPTPAEDALPHATEAWGETALRLPDEFMPDKYYDVFAGTETAPRGGSLPVAQMLQALPVALLMSRR